MLILFGWVGVVWGQDTALNYNEGLGDTLAKKEYTEKNTFVGSTNMRGDFSVDVSKDFAASLKLNIESKNKDLSFLFQNDLGSTNNYSPLFDKGQWALDNRLSATAKWHFKTTRWFFESDVDAIKSAYSEKSNENVYKELEMAKKLSQYRTIWLSGGIGWDYKEYSLLSDQLSPTIESPFISDRKNSFVLSGALNTLWVTSYRHGLYITASLGYSYQNKGTNYEKLPFVTVSKYSEIKDDQNNIIRVSEPDKKGRKGALIVSNSHTINGDIHFTIAPPNSAVGFDIFTTPTLKFIGSDEILNVRTGVNVAIVKKDKSKVNIGLVLDLKDLTESFKSKEDKQNRIVPGLMIGIPIPSL